MRACLYAWTLAWLVAVLLTGCATHALHEPPREDIEYSRELEVRINGVPVRAASVLPLTVKYEIEAPGSRAIEVLTCHRSHRVLGDKYEFYPVRGIEDERGCVLELVAEKDAGYGLAWFDFETITETLPVNLFCDGSETNTGAVSVCHAKAGLVQRIVFSEPVKVAPIGGCDVLTARDDFTYEYVMPNEECTWYFGTRDRRYHRHTALPFKERLP